ncbi:hypothetical protein SEUCBS139899_008701 [Sporothrix eucalyptigena]
MLTPAAKRRRAEAASATLSRPFRSPSVRRDGAGGVKPSKPSLKAETRSETMGKTTARPVSPLQAPPATASPERKHKRPRPASQLRSVHQPKKEKEDLSLDSLVYQFCLDLDADDQIIADAQTGATEDGLPTTALAKEQTNEDKNKDLRILIFRWKEAGRLAAEDVFSIVSERVARAGGVKAWRAMTSLPPEMESSGAQREGRRRRHNREDDDDEDESGQSNDEDEDEDEDIYREDPEEKEEEDDTQEFTMAMMLASLHVDPNLLGYDEAEERWKD